MQLLSYDTEQEIIIPTETTSLNGFLYIPTNAKGLVLFVHGSGSSRFSVRNKFVAQTLNTHGFATLLFDLLSAEEEQIDNYSAELRFNIHLLSSRLIDVTHWCMQLLTNHSFKLGYFGSSTGAAAALVAAAKLPNAIHAVVSRGGRPDLANKYLGAVEAPTLLIVGGEDDIVIKLNHVATTYLRCSHQLAIVPGATHLFEESGKLEEVATLAIEWFNCYLS